MAAKQKDPPAVPETVSSNVIAGFAGLTRQRIDQMAEEGKIPSPGKRGEYLFRESIFGIIQDLRDKAKGKYPGEEIDKARRARAEADSAELDAAEKAREVIAAEDMLFIWREAVIEVRRVIEEADYLKEPQKTRLMASLAKIEPKEEK